MILWTPSKWPQLTCSKRPTIYLRLKHRKQDALCTLHVEGTKIPLAAVKQRLKMLTSDDLADVQEAVARSGTTAESGSVKYLKSCLYNAPLNARYAKIITGGAT